VIKIGLLPVFLVLVIGCSGNSLRSEEPRGLVLRKGLLRWQAPLKEARTFIEEGVRPQSLILLQGQKEEGFRCEQQAPTDVNRCIWACCVDLGVKDTVFFATLWFYKDRFYAYDLAFPTTLFPGLFATLEKTFGRPAKEQQESQIDYSSMLLGSGVSSYIVNTRRWDTGKTTMLLADRGGQGKLLAGHLYVVALPIAREIPTEKKSVPSVKPPF
jgi:hypothetical protein